MAPNSDTESGEEKEIYQGIYENEEERERVMRMPELEREKFISERFSQ
jgi:hypothetical protein